MSVNIVNPFHLAVAIQYSLNLLEVANESNKSLASFFFKQMLSKIKQQYLANAGVKIKDDDNISALDKCFYKELEDDDFFDVQSFRSSNFKFLARLLSSSNYQSYNDKYNESNYSSSDIDLFIQAVIDQKDKAQVKANELSVFQFIKLVDCIDYQCCEMINYEKSLCKSYTQLVAYFAARHNNEYKTSEWELIALPC